MLDEEDDRAEDEAEQTASENYNRPWDLLKASIENTVEGVNPRTDNHHYEAKDFRRT